MKAYRCGGCGAEWTDNKDSPAYKCDNPYCYCYEVYITEVMKLHDNTGKPIETIPEPATLADGGFYITQDSDERKASPFARGLVDYFPAALLAVAHASFVGSLKHNKGEPMHHARGKGGDHADCIGRHLVERGGWDTIYDADGKPHRVRHSAWLAWRALALLQEEIENEEGVAPARAARFPEDKKCP